MRRAPPPRLRSSFFGPERRVARAFPRRPLRPLSLPPRVTGTAPPPCRPCGTYALPRSGVAGLTRATLNCLVATF